MLAYSLRAMLATVNCAEPPKGRSWTFLILPKDASAKLPTRGMTTVEDLISSQRLDPLDHVRQAVGDSRASDPQCLRDARCRKATRVLF